VATVTPQTLAVTTSTHAMVHIPLTNRQVIDLTELSGGKPLSLECRCTRCCRRRRPARTPTSVCGSPPARGWTGSRCPARPSPRPW
jgi:hypothetical protein